MAAKLVNLKKERIKLMALRKLPELLHNMIILVKLSFTETGQTVLENEIL